MKKFIALLMAMAMVLSLAACGSSSSASEDTAAETTAAETAAAETAAAETAAAETAAAETAAAAEATGDNEVVAEADADGYVHVGADVDLSGYTFGYVTINSSAPWGGLVGTSFQEYAEEAGAKVNALDAQTNADQVTEYCNQMIDAGVDALVVFGGDINAMCDVAASCTEAGIPLFLCALDVAEAGRGDVTAVIGPDQQQMCADIAAYVVEQNGTDEDYTVLQINGVPFLEDYIERCAGFQGYMADYSNYDLSTTPEDCYSDRTAGQSAMETWLTMFDASTTNLIVMGYDDDLTLGAVQAIDEAGLTGQIKVYSLTGQNDAIQAVADGKMELTVFNSAKSIGAETVNAIYEYLTTGSTAYYHRTPLTYITADNVNDWIGNGEIG